MARNEIFMGPPGPFPDTPPVNLGASFGQPATNEAPKTVTIVTTGGVKIEVPAANVGGKAIVTDSH